MKESRENEIRIVFSEEPVFEHNGINFKKGNDWTLFKIDKESIKGKYVHFKDILKKECEFFDTYSLNSFKAVGIFQANNGGRLDFVFRKIDDYEVFQIPIVCEVEQIKERVTTRRVFKPEDL